jgi:mRNA-degrading endonuclease RelE of RelBE toxin-antitoxin system
VACQIEFTRSAQDHLNALTARDRRIVLTAINVQLSYEPRRPTRNRKRLRPNPVAPWALRIRQLRVFYEVADDESVVWIVAVGRKQRHMVMIAGEEVRLEGD